MGEVINVNLFEDEDWDFRGADTKYMTHDLHPRKSVSMMLRQCIVT